MESAHRDEREFHGDSEPGADIIALPQLERLPPDPDFPDSGASSFTSDNRSARLEALELVRAAVEIADRIEKDAHETAKDRLTRTEEEVRLRRGRQRRWLRPLPVLPPARSRHVRSQP